MKKQLLLIAPLLLSACAAPQPKAVPKASPLADETLVSNSCGNLLEDYETFSLMDEVARKQRLNSVSSIWMLTRDSCEQLRLSLLLSQPQGSDKDRQKALKLLKELLTNNALQDPQARQLAALLRDQLQLARAQKLRTLDLRHRLQAQRAASRGLSEQLDNLQSQLQQLKNIEKNINEKEQSIITPSTDNVSHEPP
ncbi:hypothetical protein [Thiolapillus sp.]